MPPVPVLLPVLFWVILILAALGFFSPPSWAYGRYIGGGATLALFIIIGLRLFRSSLALIAIFALPIAFSGCLNEQTGNAATDKRHRIENQLGRESSNVVWDFALSSVGRVDGAAALERVMAAAAGPKLGAVAAEAYTTANPQTQAEKAIVINSIGAALQNAANERVGIFASKTP